MAVELERVSVWPELVFLCPPLPRSSLALMDAWRLPSRIGTRAAAGRVCLDRPDRSGVAFDVGILMESDPGGAETLAIRPVLRL